MAGRSPTLQTATALHVITRWEAWIVAVRRSATLAMQPWRDTMLICDKLVFIELQKTGSTHIKQLLRELVGGVNDGKHNTPDERMLQCGKPFIGSVRNPWLWYLSLWSYGCQSKGELFQRLTNEKRWKRLREKVEAKQHGKLAAAHGDDDDEDEDSVERRLPADWDAERAKYWYADPDNAEAFREWMHAVLGRRTLRHMLMAGYGNSPLGKAGGLMTYRYFHLFVKGVEEAGPTMNNLLKLRLLDRSNCIVSHFIRNESLAEDFINVVQSCGIGLTDAQREQILSARKVNTSTRPHGPGYYYDEACVKLVARREKFIIEKFGYRDARPRLDSATAAVRPALAAVPSTAAPTVTAPTAAVADVSAGARLMAEAAAARRRRKQHKTQWESGAAVAA